MPHTQHVTSRPANDHHLFNHRPYERPLYPVALLGEDDELDQPQDVVEFAGYQFGRAKGEWRLLDRVDIALEGGALSSS